MSGYRYIGKGEVKYIDKANTKLGAFLNIDIESLTNVLTLLKNTDPDAIELLIYALPNKTGTHSVKIKI